VLFQCLKRKNQFVERITETRFRLETHFVEDTSAIQYGGLKTRFTADTPLAGDKREMALRAGLVASQRLWFTSVNGYGSYEREKKRREKTGFPG
jgi:hypothetical protein